MLLTCAGGYGHVVAKSKAVIILPIQHDRTINSGNLIQPGTRDPPVLSHTDILIGVRTYVETFAHSYAPAVLQISG